MIRLDDNPATALVAALIASGAISLALAWGYPRLRARLEAIDPAARSWILLGLVMAPLACGLIIGGLILTPVMDYGPVGHHCHYGSVPGCEPHAQTALTEALSLALVALTAALSILPLCRLVPPIRELGRGAAVLVAVGRRDCDTGIHLLDDRRPAAFSLGLFSPRIFVTTGLKDALGPDELRIVARHERAHSRRKDSLRSLLGRVFALGHLPASKRQLLEDLHLAAEQACDAEAARITGDRLDVAAVILKVERLYRDRGSWLPQGAHALTGGCVPARVEALIQEPADRPSARPALAVIAAGIVVGALFLAAEPLHHLIEDMIQPLLG